MKTTHRLMRFGIVLALSCACTFAQEPAPKLPDEAQRIMKEYELAVDAARTRTVQALERAMASQTAHGNLEGALAIRNQIEDLSSAASDKTTADQKLVGHWKLFAPGGDSGEIVFKSGLRYEATKWFAGGTATITENKLTFGDGIEMDLSKGVRSELSGSWHGAIRKMTRIK